MTCLISFVEYISRKFLTPDIITHLYDDEDYTNARQLGVPDLLFSLVRSYVFCGETPADTLPEGQNIGLVLINFS